MKYLNGHFINSELLFNSSIIPISNAMTLNSLLESVVLSIFPVPFVTHHYQVTQVCNLYTTRFFSDIDEVTWAHSLATKS